MSRASSPDRALAAWIAAGLAAAVAAVYAPALGHEFVRYDDPEYILRNPAVRAGLTLDGLRWALTATHAANWHPLTWASHMLDVTLFGLAPAGHHLVGILIHACNASLLFLVLRAMTVRMWPPALAAALFALHPLRVESVAWAAERKDLLAGLFWILTLAAWTFYARRPSWRRYLAVAFLLAAGLAAKPSLVVLPAVLLLFDAWPLRRTVTTRWGSLIVEKLPLAALSVLSAVLTIAAQRAGGAMARLEEIPLGARLLNAVASCGWYLGKTVVPSGLAVFYPHPATTHPEAASAALAVPAIVSGTAIVAITVVALRERRRRPWLLAGWGAYLIALLPVIGLVQVGNQARADRYTYLPSIGLGIAGVWALAELAERRPAWGKGIAATAFALLVALGLATSRQLATWKDSRSLFERAIAVTRDNDVAHNNLGNLLADDGDLAGAEAHYRAALAVRPGLAEAWNGLGTVRAAQGDPAGAAAAYASALEARPAYVEAHYNLALSLEALGRIEEARAHYRAALALRPDLAEARARLEALDGDPF